MKAHESVKHMYGTLKRRKIIMSARVFKFRNKGKAFDRLEVDKSGYWHLVPGKDVIKELFEELRGGDNNDYVDIAEFSKGEETLIQFAGLDGEAPNPGKANVMLGLRDFVTENTPDDLSSMGGISARRDDRGNNAVYAQGDGRIVAVGYYDNAKSDKGIMMAALILYVPGRFPFTLFSSNRIISGVDSISSSRMNSRS